MTEEQLKSGNFVVLKYFPVYFCSQYGSAYISLYVYAESVLLSLYKRYLNVKNINKITSGHLLTKSSLPQ